MKTKKKKSQGKGLLLAVLVLLLLIAVYVLIDLQQKKAEEKKETEEIESTLPVSASEEELSKVTVTYDGEVMTFLRNGEEESWSYQEDPEFPLDSASLSGKMDRLENVTVNRTLEPPEELSEYGLEDPILKVAVEKSDKTSYTLLFGAENSSTGDCYMQVEGEAPVYTVESSLPAAFEINPYDVAVSETFPSITADSIKRIRVEKEGQVNEFVTDEETGLSWTFLAEDGTENKVDSTAMGTLKSAAAGLGYNGFTDYQGEDLAAYGLDQPSAKITVMTEETEIAEAEESSETEKVETEESSETEETTETEKETETITVEKELVLEIGAKDGNGNYYVKQRGSQEIHTMSEATLEPLLEIEKMDYLNTYLNDVPMNTFKELKVTYQGETKVLSIETEEVPVETEEAEETDSESETKAESETETETETEQKMKTVSHYLVNGEEMDETAFRVFYNHLILLTAQRRMEEEEAEVQGDAELILEFTREDGTTLKTEYYPGTDGLYTVLSDQALPGKANKLEVQEVIENYQELLESPKEPETETETSKETE
jgi:hypothetical protein